MYLVLNYDYNLEPSGLLPPDTDSEGDVWQKCWISIYLPDCLQGNLCSLDTVLLPKYRKISWATRRVKQLETLAALNQNCYEAAGGWQQG